MAGFEHWPDHCVVLLGETLYSRSASPASGVMGTGKLVEQPNKMLGGNQTGKGLASHPGGVAILLVVSCYGNRN